MSRCAMCYCGLCEMPFITCTQWDCPGCINGHHSYECEFCENKMAAYRRKMNAGKTKRQLSASESGEGENA